LTTAPKLLGIPVLVNIPAFAIVAVITWILLLGVRESARVNNVLVAIKLLVLALFVGAGLFHIHPQNYHPFAPNGLSGIHHGAAIIFFAYIGFDSISTAAEETSNPQRNMPLGILGGLVLCTVIYIIVSIVLTGMVPSSSLGVADPLAVALQSSGLQTVSTILSLGAIFSMAAVLLVFQYGQPRIFFSMARDGLLPAWASRVHQKYRVPWATTILTGAFVALWALIGDAGETFDLTNIGTLFAFVLVCLGVLALRRKEPDRKRPFRVPFVWPVALGGAASCIFLMAGLPGLAWRRFVIWLGLGLVLYFLYGIRKSGLRKSAGV
jgi:APA family basic amino acid/polyamine antiporter